jgi:CxxC motif-containing protein (DUF1111 family)
MGLPDMSSIFQHTLQHCRRHGVAAVAVGVAVLLAACGGGSGGKDATTAPVTTPVAGTTPGTGSGATPGTGTDATPATGTDATPDTGDSTSTTPTTPATGDSTTPVAATYTALSWPSQQASTQYTLANGTLVTQLGGRTRDRHAREQPEAAGEGDNYLTFAAHYFERRSHQITIYENVSPTNANNRILTVVVRPSWWWYGTNFRHSYIGRRDDDALAPASVALYGDNGGMKRLPAGSLLANAELATPLTNYDALPSDPGANYAVDLNVPPADGEFVLVKQITTSQALKRELRSGDLLEFELGIFLAGEQGDTLGRFNYYSEAVVYQVGKGGVQPWYRGPCCDTPIPWEAKVLPTAALSGGAMMTLQEDSSYMPQNNFLQAGTNIAPVNIQPFLEGRRLFHTSFLAGVHSEAGNPVFTAQAGKAGPKFQQSACIACHVNNGKSSPVLGKTLNTMVVLTGASDSNGNLVNDSRFGDHLTQGLITEAGTTYDGRQALLTVASYTQTTGQYPDATSYTLQTPVYALTDTAGKALTLPTRLSVRTAPHLAGMGLLEAVPESTLAALAAASASDIDGVTGTLQIIADVSNPSVKRVGRFGWRGTSASVLQQTAAALNNDMGVTSTLYPTHNCGLATDGTACRTADAKGPELSDADVELMVRYTSLLAVPAARHFAGQQPLGTPGDKVVLQTTAERAAEQSAESTLQQRVKRGGELFVAARCVACHTATLTTGASHKFAELRNQTIHPYSDLLLHDMGPALADNYPQGVASGQQWRTAPLWGLGLLAKINANTRYLHDGRARTVEEAVLWHGGQGQKSLDRFKALSADDRAQMIDFINSL